MINEMTEFPTTPLQPHGSLRSSLQTQFSSLSVFSHHTVRPQTQSFLTPLLLTHESSTECLWHANCTSFPRTLRPSADQQEQVGQTRSLGEMQWRP
jgi:hypothetical protein